MPSIRLSELRESPPPTKLDLKTRCRLRCGQQTHCKVGHDRVPRDRPHLGSIQTHVGKRQTDQEDVLRPELIEIGHRLDQHDLVIDKGPLDPAVHGLVNRRLLEADQDDTCIGQRRASPRFRSGISEKSRAPPRCFALPVRKRMRSPLFKDFGSMCRHRIRS